MKLRYDFLNHEIEISKDEPTLLVIENSSLIDKYICELNGAIEKVSSSFHLLLDEKEIDISKRATIITSPLDLVFSKRSFQKALYKEITDTMKILGLDYEIGEITSRYVNLLESLCVSYEYDLNYEADISVIDILGLFKVHLNDPKGSFAEKFVDYARATKGLISKDVFILFNCLLYMGKEELQYIVEEAIREQIHVLFVEAMDTELLQGKVHKYIIDMDVCEINNIENHMELQCDKGIYSEITI